MGFVLEDKCNIFSYMLSHTLPKQLKNWVGKGELAG